MNNSKSDWNPDLYLAFARERTQPSIDLAARIHLAQPRRIIDIGCGPGNSTQILRQRWPSAEIIGLDSSETMLAQTRKNHPDIHWHCADAAGELTALGSFDIVFSNAAIQWMPAHKTLLPNLFALLAPGGVLAIQVPFTQHMPTHIEAQNLAASAAWRGRFTHATAAHSVHDAPYYFDILSTLSASAEIWQTTYYHVMADHRALVRWYSGSGLRPYLDCLADENERAQFVQEYEEKLRSVYPRQANGAVLFPFTRIFFTAKKD